jgi:ribonuclease HI
MDKIKVYTDGACSGNPGIGGYAAIILDNYGNEVSLSGGEEHTTNNRMEMSALINSLNYIRNNFDIKNSKIEMFVDSQYLLKGTTEWLEGWKRKNWKATNGPVKNKELWEEIDRLIQGLDIKWTWIKGHAGNRYNEIADQLAVGEIEKIRNSKK